MPTVNQLSLSEPCQARAEEPPFKETQPLRSHGGNPSGEDAAALFPCGEETAEQVEVSNEVYGKSPGLGRRLKRLLW